MPSEHLRSFINKRQRKKKTLQTESWGKILLSLFYCLSEILEHKHQDVLWSPIPSMIHRACYPLGRRKEYTTKSLKMFRPLYGRLQSTMFWRVMVALETSQGLLYKKWASTTQRNGDSTFLPFIWRALDWYWRSLWVQSCYWRYASHHSQCCFLFIGHYCSASTFKITSPKTTVSGSLHLLRFLLV